MTISSKKSKLLLFTILVFSFLTNQVQASPVNDILATAITDNNGCFASTETQINVDANPQDSTFIFAGSCDPDDVGITTLVFQNQSGCDSFVTITISLLESNNIYLESTTCDPAEAGIFQSVYTNQFGCDSIINSLVALSAIPSTPVAPDDTLISQNSQAFDLFITDVPGATEYLWTVPSGVQILSGQSTTAIVVDWGTATSGSVCVSAINECGSSETDCMEVSVEFETGLTDSYENQFTIFPSPAKEIIHIDFQNEETYELALIDLLGRVVLPSASHTRHAQLVVSDLASGVYWLKISSGVAFSWEQVIIE